MSFFSRMTLSSLAACAVLAAAPMALAHGDSTPKHGGQVAMTGEVMFELVNGPKGVDLYVIDDEEPIAASGYSAKLTITAGAKKSEAAMKAVKANQFNAPGAKLAPGTKVGVTLVNTASSARTFATFTVK